MKCLLRDKSGRIQKVNIFLRKQLEKLCITGNRISGCVDVVNVIAEKT